MKRAILVVVVILAAVIVFFLANASSDAVDGLAGDPWMLVGVKKGGREVPKNMIEGIKFTKTDATWILMTAEGPQGVPCEYKIDSTKQPKQINIETPVVDPGGRLEMPVMPGIYDVKNDVLIIALGERGRPTDFSSRGGMVLVFKR